MSKSITSPSVSRIHVSSIISIVSLQAFPGIFIMVVWYTILLRESLPVPSNIPYLPFLITLGAGTTFSVTLLAHIVSCPRRVCWVAYTLTNLFTAIALPCILSSTFLSLFQFRYMRNDNPNIDAAEFLDWEGIRIFLREDKMKIYTVFIALLPVFTHNMLQMVFDDEMLSAKKVLCHPSPEDAACAGRDASNLNQSFINNR
ncbi:hypothetical protein JVT61DRAFT_8835 [Boletus reticuloceps]|uniref:Uncharacterized protein n=1 Tax=Boletus reticuloceps TaxID=495285 RepID=A0A8I3A6W3_9AGAM|nr:hypothetical protein JVT61DRAFT_8835 [Boletus reticuloceps]